MPTLRDPVVAGTFYPRRREALTKVLSDLLGGVHPAATPLCGPEGLIAPHAGYLYSGGVAAAGYRELARRGRPEAAVVLGANHTGLGGPIAVARDGAWRTPLGDAPIDTTLADKLTPSGAELSGGAFGREHSVEVQLPFMQYLFGEEMPFVPVVIMAGDPAKLIAFGERAAEAVRGRPVLVVASSDFTHYDPDATARESDRRALERILALDTEGFIDLLRAERLSICGGGSIAVLITMARALGWTPRLAAYATSGDVTGDRSAVVGYAAVVFEGGCHG